MVDAIPMKQLEDADDGVLATAPTVCSAESYSLPAVGEGTSGDGAEAEQLPSEKREDRDCSDQEETPASIFTRSPVVIRMRPARQCTPEYDTLFPPLQIAYDQVSSDDEPEEPPRRLSCLVTPLRPRRDRRRLSTDHYFHSSDDIHCNDFGNQSELILSQSFSPPSESFRRQFSYTQQPLPNHGKSSFHAERHQHQQQQQQPAKPPRKWLIPAEHPYKILWDVLTFVLSLLNFYATHAAIRDRQFGNSWFMSFCDGWFMFDILLNFFTEYRSDQIELSDCRSVWARYLTTWFVVDVLSLIPGEKLYLRPIIDKQNRRNFFQKSFFRSKAVVRVTRILRGRHFKMFGRAVKHTKHAGVGTSRLLKLLIKYIPKYLLFFRNMKGVLAVRMLRQIHWFRKCWRNFLYKDELDENGKPIRKDMRTLLCRPRPVYDDDDDGAPF